MVRNLMHDPFFLGIASKPASLTDADTARDLLDTLKAHSETCVGMAANMIGVSKRIIAFRDGGSYVVMYNPVIIARAQPYETEEGCLSLLGGAKPRAGSGSPSATVTAASARKPKPTRASRRRSSSMRWITATA